MRFLNGWLRPLETQPATRNFFRFSLGARACVCVPYIYKIKIKKKNIPIGLRLRAPENTPKNQKRNRVAGCAFFIGDWKDYYVAQIEVWHRNAGTKQEMKLPEKVYCVDGLDSTRRI